ncbi:uncharacterized protein LOC142227172 [Haematobia irritans]|uniref:uncharacterized protein LOC142227172 n=1 Tax=Haematobia irritans TaxID=7368 RepID=UPI003F4F5A05
MFIGSSGFWAVTRTMWNLILKVSLIFYCIDIAHNKEPICYAMSFFDTSWTDRRPYFRVNMTFSNEGFIESRTWVERDIAYPVSKLRISQRGLAKAMLPPFNITARVCDLYNALSQVPAIKNAFLSVTKGGNASLTCPMKAGFYLMGNIRFEKNGRILSLLYRPKAYYLFEGGLYEELKNRKLSVLTTYRFSAKVVKVSCKE